MQVEYKDILAIIGDANTMLNLDEITPNDDLRDLGADSLDFMNILLLIQEKYGVEIPDNELENLASIEAICQFINQRV